MEEAYQIAMRVALIEASCWELQELRKIKHNDGSKMKKAKADKINHHFNGAEDAISNYHQTYEVCKRTRCRQCPSTCLSKNNDKHWAKIPCYPTKLASKEPVLAVSRELAANFKKHRMDEEIEHRQINSDNDEHEAKEEIVCSRPPKMKTRVSTTGAMIAAQLDAPCAKRTRIADCATVTSMSHASTGAIVGQQRQERRIRTRSLGCKRQWLQRHRRHRHQKLKELSEKDCRHPNDTRTCSTTRRANCKMRNLNKKKSNLKKGSGYRRNKSIAAVVKEAQSEDRCRGRLPGLRSQANAKKSNRLQGDQRGYSSIEKVEKAQV